MSQPLHFYNRINVCSEKFPGILDEFKKNYVIYNTHPDFQEYENAYGSSKAALAGLNKDLFLVINDVQQETNILNENAENLVMQIEQLKQENEDLNKTLSNSGGTNRGADEMNDDAKEQFKIQYIKNITMFLGNIFLILVMFKIFKK
jgi:ABC-type Zn uptake system ZnuABC Zn-binding protein ZnuA